MQREFRERRSNEVIRRTTRVVVSITDTTSLLTSPHDNLLEPSNKEDCKLFNDAFNGLKKDDRCDRKIINVFKFLKLIVKDLED